MPTISEADMKSFQRMKERQRKKNKYLQDRYDQVNLIFPKGYKAKIDKAAAELNISTCELCRKIIMTALGDSPSDIPVSSPYKDANSLDD